jgi:hypothetical protein
MPMVKYPPMALWIAPAKSAPTNPAARPRTGDVKPDTSRMEVPAIVAAEPTAASHREKGVDGGARQADEELLHPIGDGARHLDHVGIGPAARIGGNALRSFQIIALQKIKAGARNRPFLGLQPGEFRLVR